MLPAPLELVGAADGGDAGQGSSPFEVPIGTTGQRIELLASAIAWLGCIAFLVWWWCQAWHWPDTTGLVLYSAIVGFELFEQAIWVLSLLRTRRPNSAVELPSARVAMVVTKAPSEPWPMVRATLEAMLSQSFPRPYQVWLADEHPSHEAYEWCERNGVLVSTRMGIEAYHRSSWPRRTRCKEGNLAYFYDTFGYEGYDLVVQLDADHVPSPSYLRHMISPFVDPSVGYVAAPSLCDSNADESWAARGRLYAEATFHGGQQLGVAGRFAPTCIGSHYAVRTRALAQIGGLGPELAEDFSTTLLMNAGGWRGMFAVDAIAHGAGPECLADCVRQEFQWARSLMVIMLRHTGAWRDLRLGAKLRLGWSQLWYPLLALVQLTWVAIPVISVLSHRPLMNTTIPGFYLHVFAPLAGVYVLVTWCRRRDLLRPLDGSPFQWEAMLFQFIRWPWAALGCAAAIVDCVTGREFNFKVTPKGADAPRTLHAVTLVPYLVLAAVSLAPALLVVDAGPASGYYVWCVINGAVYALVALAAIALHVRENASTPPRRGWWRQLQVVSPSGLLCVIALALSAVGCGVLRLPQVEAVLRAPGLTSAGPSPPTAQSVRASHGVSAASTGSVPRYVGAAHARAGGTLTLEWVGERR
ncbi:MAG: glycosyltransferase [Solirubrobacterales bacterium]|nr:glycosyltransferase [Solirubrobacterales bacterium]